MRAVMLGRNVSGKSFVADRGINERRGRSHDGRETIGAGGATLLSRIGPWCVPVAFVTR